MVQNEIEYSFSKKNGKVCVCKLALIYRGYSCNWDRNLQMKMTVEENSPKNFFNIQWGATNHAMGGKNLSI